MIDLKDRDKYKSFLELTKRLYIAFKDGVLYQISASCSSSRVDNAVSIVCTLYFSNTTALKSYYCVLGTASEAAAVSLCCLRSSMLSK
jgi:hypothetical protein